MFSPFGLSGWLKKRGDKGLVLGLTWQVRFFCQTGATELSYFKDSKPDAPKKGFIDLTAGMHLRPCGPSLLADKLLSGPYHSPFRRGTIGFPIWL